MRQIKVGILGGSGYGGAELLRILLQHPNTEISLVTANEHAGKAVGEVHKNLYGLTDLNFVTAPEKIDELDTLDCLFLALPHGQAMGIVPQLSKSVKVIDLSGDFRLRDQAEFETHYGRTHTAMDAQSGFVYGLTETKSRSDSSRNQDQQSRMLCNRGNPGSCAFSREQCSIRPSGG